MLDRIVKISIGFHFIVLCELFDLMNLEILGLGTENTGQFIIVQWPKIQSMHIFQVMFICIVFEVVLYLVTNQKQLLEILYVFKLNSF